jgi:hypothetical protein
VDVGIAETQLIVVEDATGKEFDLSGVAIWDEVQDEPGKQSLWLQDDSAGPERNDAVESARIGSGEVLLAWMQQPAEQRSPALPF